MQTTRESVGLRSLSTCKRSSSGLGRAVLWIIPGVVPAEVPSDRGSSMHGQRERGERVWHAQCTSPRCRQGRLEPLEVRDVKDAVCHASALGPGLPLRGENQGGGRSLPGRDKFVWCRGGWNRVTNSAKEESQGRREWGQSTEAGVGGAQGWSECEGFG